MFSRLHSIIKGSFAVPGLAMVGNCAIEMAVPWKDPFANLD